MTTREGLALAAEQFGDEMVSTFERLEAARRNLPAPRTSESLVEEVAVLGVGPGYLVANVGAWGGQWSERLTARYGCRCIALDLSPKGLYESAARGVPAVVADAEVLPLPAGSVDLVWCRDTMSTLESPQAVLTEFVRILRPGGGVMLYTAVTTPRLEPSEHGSSMRSKLHPGGTSAVPRSTTPSRRPALMWWPSRRSHPSTPRR
jgi:ubiquinone/menaquinone biosynthesis C-methylase UbiE